MNSIADRGIEWLSRTIAILLVMVGPALAGSYLDDRLGTRFLMPSALIAGVLMSMALLLVLAKQFTPPARGKPLPLDEDDQEHSPRSDDADTADH